MSGILISVMTKSAEACVSKFIADGTPLADSTDIENGKESISSIISLIPLRIICSSTTTSI